MWQSVKTISLGLGCVVMSGTIMAQAIDHNCIDINQIPPNFLEKARKELRVSYGHSVIGSQIISGMDALKKANPVLYNFSTSTKEIVPDCLSVWDCIPPNDLGTPDRLLWAENTEKLLDGPGKDRNLVMWAWGGHLSNAKHGDIQHYLKLMNELEKKYPAVKFVYMTGPLDGSGEKGTLNERNDQIREYCRKNNKLLYDFADIESYSPGGSVNYMKFNGTNACTFINNGKKRNWAMEWEEKNPNHGLIMPVTSAHSHPLNALMKGRAFWWMMAVVSGWTPPAAATTSAVPLAPVTKAVAPTTNTPPPQAGISRLYRFDRIQDFRPWVLFGSTESLIPENGNGMQIPPGSPSVAMYRGLYTIAELEFKARLISGNSINWYINTDWTDTWNPKIGIGGVANENGCLLIINGETIKFPCPVKLEGMEHRFQIVIKNNHLVWGIDKFIVAEYDLPPSLADRKGSLAIGGWKSTVMFNGVYLQTK